MGALGLVFALVFSAYIVGVWTGGLVFRQRQRAYEESEQGEIASPMRIEGREKGRHPSAAFDDARLEIELVRVGDSKLEICP
jgi:hypothetical protein